MAAKKRAINLFSDPPKGIEVKTQETSKVTNNAVEYPSDTLLAYRNTLQTVAQMRAAQIGFFKSKDSAARQGYLIESKKLESSVDIRLSSLGIKAI